MPFDGREKVVNAGETQREMKVAGGNLNRIQNNKILRKTRERKYFKCILQLLYQQCKRLLEQPCRKFIEFKLSVCSSLLCTSWHGMAPCDIQLLRSKGAFWCIPNMNPDTRDTSESQIFFRFIPMFIWNNGNVSVEGKKELTFLWRMKM